jgi:hypothetical protein
MYGFVEVYPENVFDCVEIPAKYLIESFLKQKTFSDELIQQKIEVMKEIELIDKNACIIIGNDGILNEEECLHIFQVLTNLNNRIVQSNNFKKKQKDLFNAKK